jgi:hypothetical protein
MWTESAMLARPRALRRTTSPPTAPLSLRQWFWNGLIQDRPFAIAVFTVLLVATLAGAAVGLCFVLARL